MDALRACVSAWTEPDAARRLILLVACWTEDSEIIGPGCRFKGVRAVLDRVERFWRERPGFGAVLTSGFDRQHNGVRFTVAVVNPAGHVVNEGWVVVELDGAGKIAHVISFWGALPPAAADQG